MAQAYTWNKLHKHRLELERTIECIPDCGSPKQARSCFPAAYCLPVQAQSCWLVACCYAVASSSRSGEPLLMQVLSPPHNYAPQEANTNDGPLALYASYLFYCQKRSPQRQKGACAVWRTRGHCAAAGLTCGWYACGRGSSTRLILQLGRR